jgi:hypothetical protein
MEKNFTIMEKNFIKQYLSLPKNINYNNDEEYRRMIRICFSFEKDKFYNYEGLVNNLEICDNITADELLFDSDKSNFSLDYIFNLTINIEQFSNMYTMAAGRMFSTDKSIGQAVLFSYDTFKYFHTCLWTFFNYGIESMINTSEYNYLVQYLK